jgi:hypothetical protein
MSQATDNAYDAFVRMQGPLTNQPATRTVTTTEQQMRATADDVMAIRSALTDLSAGLANLVHAIERIENATTRGSHPSSGGVRRR